MNEPATAPSTCSSEDRRRIMRDACALGVPRDYASMRHLRSVREPVRLESIGYDISTRPQWLAPAAAKAWLRMRDQAGADGIALQVVSGYRSAEYQLLILTRKLERGLSIDDILRVSAAPGYSEHHSGRAVDVTTPGFAVLEEEFAGSPAFAWLSRHAGEYGFALSYPRGNRHGIAYEPWHWCWHARNRRASAARDRSPHNRSQR